ncbi:MAG: nodulation protein NfeD [Candidatus Bipolaricaulia bacterium]
MKIFSSVILVSLFCFFSFIITTVWASDDQGAVHVISVTGTVEHGLATYIERAVGEAEQAGARAIVLEINTLGGRVDSALRIKDAFIHSETPTIALVTGRAISAGAFIAIAADSIYMSATASIGAAQVVTGEGQPASEKAQSFFRAEMAATAEAKGRDPNIARAMVDPDVEIEGVVETGKLLTLTAIEAAELDFIDGVAESLQEALAQEGIEGGSIIRVPRNWAERAAGFLTDPTISSLLLTLGFLGLLVEVTTAGWGVPGSLGLLSLGLFFGGHLVAQVAGLESILLFVVGLVLLAVEIFVIPGFGIAGLTGFAALLAGIVLAFPGWQEGLQSLGIALGVTAVVSLILLRYLPRSRLWRRLVLSTAQRREIGYVGVPDYQMLQDKEGWSVTPLRPAGTAEVDGERYDVVAEGEFIPAAAPIRIVRVEGRRIIAREIEREAGTSAQKPDSDQGS